MPTDLAQVLPDEVSRSNKMLCDPEASFSNLLNGCQVIQVLPKVHELALGFLAEGVIFVDLGAVDIPDDKEQG